MHIKNLLHTSSFACLLTLPLALTACSVEIGDGDGGDDVNMDDGTTDGGTDDGTTDGTTETSTDDDVGTTDTTDTTDGTDTTDTTDTTDATDTGGEDMGMLRLMHLGVFPNDENTEVEIFVNGEASGIAFSFKEGTDYVALPTGSYDFDVVPAGGTIDDSVFSVPGFELGTDEMWEIFAAGYVAPEGEDAAFTVGAFPEDMEGIAAGNIRLNVFHTGALGALTPVDVWVVDDACEPDSPLLEDFEFGQVAANVDIPAGPLNVGFDVGQDATVDACFKVPDLGADIMVNVFAVNDSEGSVSLLAHLPDGSVAEVQPE